MASSEAPAEVKMKPIPANQLATFAVQCAQFYDSVGTLFRKQAEECRKIAQSVGVTDKPKRTRREPWVPTGYQRFMSKRREEFKTEDPSVRGREIMRRAAAEWNELSEAEKSVYNEAAVSDRERLLQKDEPPVNDDDDDELMVIEATDKPQPPAEPEQGSEAATTAAKTQDDKDESEKKKKKKKRKKTTNGGDDASAKKKKKKKSEG